MKTRGNVIRYCFALLGMGVGLACASSGSLTMAAEAGASTSAAHWNIMVAPATPTAYSGEARELFDRQCASCHSRDGRAQTPTARRRGVQDLSECRLTDDKIVEQILEGTHHKTTRFKMPPFRDRLTRAQIESLVPLVKAFRPFPPMAVDQRQGAHASESLRLAGMVILPGRKYAVLEKVPQSEHYFLLAERESHDGVTLKKINGGKGDVRLWRRGTNSVVTLKMDHSSTQPSGTHGPGFILRLAEAFRSARHEVVLERAGTDLVLFLYAQFTGRTLLRSPRLPAARFTLHKTADNQAQLAFGLEKALAEKGITMIPDGETFLQVVPTSEAASVRPLAPGIKCSLRDIASPELFPGGAIINFADTAPSEVARLYAELSRKALVPAQNLPMTGAVNFTTQTPLSRQECLYAFETLLAWQGLTIGPVGAGSLKVGRK